MRPPATIVIPVWNAWKHTRRCLDSLRPTLGLRDQVVVVDNGSSDATAAELARRPWLTVITNAENRGFAAACNQGAAAATTDVVVFLNNDTLTPSRWIDALLAPLEDVGVVASGPRSNSVSGPQLVANPQYDGSKLAEVQRFARTWRESNRGTTEVDRLVGFCLAVKSAAFAGIGGFDERFEVGGYEDDDLCQRLRDAGGRLVIAHASFVHHVGHQTFDANDVDWFELQERNRAVLAAKHADAAATSGVLVSACLIVRDESANIRACLYALKDVADEVVVYDTGSIDGTPELAEEVGATVLRGQWDDDFARARNAALAHCKGTWILWIDADELVVCADPVEVRSRLSRATGCDGYKISIANAVGDGSGAPSTFDAPRVFRRARARWAGRVHEQLTPTDGQPLVWRDGLGLSIDHEGYLDAVMIGRNKSERNLRLVELALAENPDDAVGLVNHGRALLVAGQHRAAIDECAKVTGRSGVDAGVLRRAYQAIAEAGLNLRAYDEAGVAITSLRALGGADITAALLASRHAVAVGDPQRALDELDAVRPGLIDVDGSTLAPAKVAEIRARALYGMNRPGAAADVLLDSLRAGVLERGSVRQIALYLRWAGRPLDELVDASVGDYRIVLLAAVAKLHPPAAAELLDALWRQDSDDLAVLVAAAGDGSRMSVETALAWSDRFRSRGLAEHCPLVSVAANLDRVPQDRFLAGALASAVFGDDRALGHLGRAAAAVPALERPALLATLRQLCPAALPLAQAVYEPPLPEPPATDYLCSIVLPMTADLPQGIAAIQALAGSSTGEQAEVVVVSDGMDPAREQLLEGLGGDVRVVRLPVETGLAHAFNAGITAAAGDVVVLLHPSASATPGWLQVVMDAVTEQRFVRIGAAATGPAVVAAPRTAFRSVAGADSRLVDEAVLPDLVVRLRESGLGATTLAASLLTWQEGKAPVATIVDPSGRPLWDKVSLPAGGSRPAGSQTQRSEVAPRVRVHGFLNGEIGLGEAARGMVASLESAGIDVATESYDGHLNRNDHPFEARPGDGDPYPIDLVCFNADFTGMMLGNGTLTLQGQHTIGLWYWELEAIPAWMTAGLKYVDEVWVGSDFIRNALARVSRVPVLTVPPPVLTHEGRPSFSRTEVGLPESFVFGFTFDHNSTLARKNPLGVIEAFRKAFAPGEGPSLVIKAINGAQWPESHERLVRAAAQHPDVHLMEQYLPSGVSAAFTGLFDCWVSLHRSEGFGLTMAEAMGWGTPVIGTAYSANLDYMDDANSYLVPYAVGSVPPGVAAYPEGELWAEPDLEAAARIMREVWANPVGAAERGERGRATIRERYNAGAIGSVARARLDAITAGLRTPADVRR
jgi:GT2 family glycosyltransferase/glycosyltransferase involved in cell wall biosynthesis